MNEIKPTEEHLSDPFVLQLMVALAERDDEIERLQARVEELERVRKATENLYSGGMVMIDNHEYVLISDMSLEQLDRALQEAES